MPPRVLAVFAHPGEESFLAGGTLARLAEAGADVRLLTLTRGEAGPRGEYEGLSPAEFGAVRQHELEAACRALDIRRPILGGCPDGRVGTDCRTLAERAIAGALRTIRPHLVVTFGPDGVSGHPDHMAVSEIVTAAFHDAFAPRDAVASASRLYYALRSGAMPSCCRPGTTRPVPAVTTIIEMTPPAGKRKLAAVQCHRSQRRFQPPTPASETAILRAPEQFHRAARVADPRTFETALEDLLPALQRPGHHLPRHEESLT